MSLQTNCSRFRAVRTLPIFGFVSEDMIGLEASSCVALAIEKEKRNLMQFKNALSNRTLLIWWNWYVEKNKKRKFGKIIYQRARCRTSVMSCDVLDHVADEI